jgi:hypothetical protein
MRECDEQYEPHICDSGLRVEECLQRKCKDDGGPTAHAIPANARPPGKDRQGYKRGCDCRWETCRKIIFTEQAITGGLSPISEGRLVQAEVIVEVRNNVVAALNHLAGCFGKARLIAVD